MFFNSLDFAIFLPIVFVLYWFVAKNNFKSQNALIVFSSYVFYGWWDWRFLTLILFSTIIDYTVGQKLRLEHGKTKRKILLWISIVVNLGFLGFFKYYNFFLDNFIDAFSLFGMEINGNSLNIILPVGISFYTFQTLSYTIDVYNKKLAPTNDFIAFSAFVSFFPQLVAGPIERATSLLPQFYKKREFNYLKAVDGLRQILWGLFKKIVIADNCATYANDIFSTYSEQPGSILLLGAIYFTFQIYGDFSGYSDIAIGTSKLFNINLKQNFALPYFSRDIGEFWRRWHISLSTWFRDYLYIPLGGSRVSKVKQLRNTFIIFIVSGFWHGANWTFVAWGFLNAIYFIPLLLTQNNRKHMNVVADKTILPTIREFFQILFTFFLTVIAWVFFRSETVYDALLYIESMFSFSLFTVPTSYRSGVLYVFVLIGIEWFTRKKQHPMEIDFYKVPKMIRWLIYMIFIYLILIYGGEAQTFIYFQF